MTAADQMMLFDLLLFFWLKYFGYVKTTLSNRLRTFYSLVDNMWLKLYIEPTRANHIILH